MNIAMLTSVNVQHAVGGAERMVALLAAQLAQRQHRVSVLTLGPIGSAVQQQSHQGVDLWSLPLVQIYDPYHAPATTPTKPPTRLQKALWHLWDVHNRPMAQQVDAVLARMAPDLVLTHALQGFSTAVWQRVRARGIPLLHMAHDHALLCPATTMTRGAEVCAKPCFECASYGHLRHALSARPDALIAPSQSVLQRHQQFGWFRDVPLQTVIPNALPDDWPPAPQPLPALQQPLVVGFLGRMDESKGIDTLLAALSHLGDLPYQVHIAGPGDAAEVAARWLQPEAAQRVRFLGRVQAAAFLQSIDVLVVPSRAHETFSNVVMEAASLGRPCIVSDRGALPERVQHGHSGWIFPAGDAHALAQTLRHCLTQPDDVRLKAERALAMRPSYDARLQCDRFEAFFAQVLAAHRP